jgi:hypothetical protein
MTIPAKVQEELGRALKKIGDVLADTNIEFRKLGFDNYMCSTSSIRFIDPDEFIDETWGVIIPPVYGEFTVDDYEVESESTSTVALYLQDRTVMYVRGKKKIKFCSNENECCGGAFRRWRCSDISPAGDVECWVCWPDRTCPETD